ncbi:MULTISPECIES: glycosyltransferase family 4 protein [unclassified Synechococcus]|uniref:glycosyltransferase family 4 protein n=1 Tax=unclassified Synechococcus TaxID=2626047 RepID=UPI0039AF823E
MNILYIHQNFPGQYRHISNHLGQKNGINQIALGTYPSDVDLSTNIKYFRYPINRGNTTDIHPLALETESKVIRAEACAQAANKLKDKGFSPDIICAHPGWGESLFLKAIWPQCPILLYQEFFYRLEGYDLNFDPEIQPAKTLESTSKAILKNNTTLLALEHSDWNVCPTHFQCSTFPQHWQQSISVIHDGIDTKLACPNPSAEALQLPNGTELKPDTPIITFVNRTLEPYRGCHTFIRAIPELQRLCPKAKIVVVGKTEGVSYGAACPDGEWKDQFLKEIDGQYDPAQVHFTGALAYEQFLHLLQLSKAHVYLTYPFVLSWSLLEAMSTQCAVVGSATAPVQEVIKDGQNGLLVDFFDHQGLAESVAELLNNRDLAETLGRNARQTILKNYSLQQCVPRQLALMKMVACGALSRR